mmetsp:Transcript_8444/g.18403  ORF Transcript_8444/g.18403 Transcript_8444/m.18403 type:complete len:223 (+) Transcript_8444:828-1496(+)
MLRLRLLPLRPCMCSCRSAISALRISEQRRGGRTLCTTSAMARSRQRPLLAPLAPLCCVGVLLICCSARALSRSTTWPRRASLTAWRTACGWTRASLEARRSACSLRLTSRWTSTSQRCAARRRPPSLCSSASSSRCRSLRWCRRCWRHIRVLRSARFLCWWRLTCSRPRRRVRSRAASRSTTARRGGSPRRARASRRTTRRTPGSSPRPPRTDSPRRTGRS